MSLLHYPRCPRCQSELPIARLYSEGRTYRGILIGDGTDWGGLLTAGNTGIVCPSCGMRLLVLQSRAVWGGYLLLLLGVIAAAFLIGDLARPFLIGKDYRWVVAVALIIVALVFFWQSFAYRYAQRFVQLRPLERGEQAAFPLSEHGHAE